MRRHDPTTKPNFLDPYRVQKGEQYWFEDFHGWNLVIECDVRGGEPPYMLSVKSYGQHDEWIVLPFDAMPLWFNDALQEAVDHAWAHGWEDRDDFLANRADMEYGDRA